MIMRCWFALITALLTFKTHAQQTVTIFTEEFSPYNYTVNGVVRGINADFTRELCRLSGVKCEFESYPWRRAFYYAQATLNSGLVSTSRTPERESLFHWVGPLVHGQSCFYKLKSRSDIQVSSRDELTNYTVGTSRSDVYHSILEEWGFQGKQTLIIYSDKHQDAQQFGQGKLDLIFASVNTLPDQLSSAGLTMQDIEPVFLFSDHKLQGNYLALNKALAPELVARFHDAYDRISGSSIADSIVNSYSSNVDLPTNLPSELHKCLRTFSPENILAEYQ